MAYQTKRWLPMLSSTMTTLVKYIGADHLYYMIKPQRKEGRKEGRKEDRNERRTASSYSGGSMSSSCRRGFGLPPQFRQLMASGSYRGTINDSSKPGDDIMPSRGCGGGPSLWRKASSSSKSCCHRGDSFSCSHWSSFLISNLER